MRRRVLAALVSVSLVSSSTFGGDWTPPSVATTWKAYEAAYPKRTVSAAVLEIESLAARLGIDVAPQGPFVADPEDQERVRRLVPDDGRVRPDPEVVKRTQSALSAAGQWVHEQLSEPSERIGPPPESVSHYLVENGVTIESIVATATRPGPIEWDLDVKAGTEAPVPNYLGVIRLDKVLAAQALVRARAGETDAALDAAEAMWRMGESVASRPELIAHLIVAAQLRLIVGLMRKIEGPSFGWEARFRERRFFQAFLVALQNDPWPSSSEPELQPMIETITRIYRRFADGLIEGDACEWTTQSLQHVWDVAASGENGPEQILVGIASESIVGMVMRWRRVLLDSEMTALVLQARGEKAASREGAWPPSLRDLESGVCPGRFYSYRRNGGIVIAFEGKVPGEERGGLSLPMSFRGAPPPTMTPTPVPALTPTPTPTPSPQ